MVIVLFFVVKSGFIKINIRVIVDKKGFKIVFIFFFFWFNIYE